MKYSFLLVFILLGLASCHQPVSDAHFYYPGISKELAAYRSQQIKNIHYQLDFSIPEKKSDSISSKLVLEVELLKVDHPLILDFNESSDKILSVFINGSEIPVKHENEHLIIGKEHLDKGGNKLEISFVAGDLSLNRNDDFLYTLLVPDRASTLFPCFDQPDLKATYNLTITAPKDWKLLAGGAEIKTEPIGESIRHVFQKSDRMSTYLFSFVAGKFQEAKSLEGMPMRMLYRETNEEKVKASIPEIFRLHQQSVDFLEAYTGFSFPFQKLDFATIPIFQYGGMEHVGAIQYREGALFLDADATDAELLSRAKLIGHETAHMWFGDLVTMRWFNDVWMKEVFANFMAGKIANPAFPQINHDLLFLTSLYPGAYAEDRTLGTNPIRQNLDNLKNAGSLYGGIIYNKAPIMMRQLEYLMGEKAFQKGIQTYIRTFAGLNADWNELVKILDLETEEDLISWSEVWVNQSSRPVFSEKIEYGPNNTLSSLIISQAAEDGSGKIWPQQFTIRLIYDQEIKEIPIKVEGKVTEITAVNGLPKPNFILFNGNGMGYGVFPVDPNGLEQIPELTDEVARASAYLNLFENTLGGRVKPLANLSILRKGLDSEQNEILIQLMSSQLNSLFWDFLKEETRNGLVDDLEGQIWELMERDLASNVKKTLFNLYSGIAFSPTGKDRLYKVWAKQLMIPELNLNPDNYTSLAMNLAVFGHEKSEEILDQERTQLQNKDRLARFDFLRPSLSPSEETRDSLFLAFAKPENREKESWVLSACRYIHHPLRQKQSVKHLDLALEWMADIQKTGDIFFPKGWATSTFGQHSSKEAKDKVELFLSANPDFNPILKNKILQAADNLYRAQRIKE